jgi:hypothetical protein
MNKEEKKERNLKIFLIIIVLLILFLFLFLIITDLKKPFNIIPYGYLTSKKSKGIKVRKNIWPFNTKTGKYLGK